MRRNREEAPEFVEGRQYTGRQLELIADEILREDTRTELCRECLEDGISEKGHETGIVEPKTQNAKDGSGTTLVLDFPELECVNGHTWFKGEGKSRGIDGENPILFEEHFASRKRREIYNSVGVPDPSIQRGLYNRVHPQGRKVNTDEQRRKNGASFYR